MNDFSLSSSFQNLACSLSKIKEKRQVLRRLYHEHFLAAFQEWKEKLNEDQQKEIEKELDLIREKLSNDELAVAFSGPNDSGKSTLINAILGKKICRAIEGRGTFRLMMIRYANIENGKVRSTLMSEGGEPRRTVVGDGIPSDFQTRPEELEMATITIEEAQLRENRMQELTKEWILVELNHPLLKCGLTLIDMPGLAEMRVLTEFVKKFLQKKKPTTIFVNSDPSFLDTTVHCLQAVVQALEKPELLNLFYVSNKFDSRLYEEDDMNELIWRRYQGFCQPPSTLVRIGLENVSEIMNLPNFACISAYEAFNKTRRGETANDLFESFLNKLEKHLINSAQLELLFCRKKLRSLNRSFFRDGPSKISFSEEELAKLAKKAKEIEQKMKNELSQDIKTWEEKTTELLKEAIPQIRLTVETKAGIIPTRFDGNNVSSTEAKEAAILVKHEIEKILHIQIADKMNPCIKELGSSLSEKFQEFMRQISKENNFFLSDGIENGYNVDLSVVQKTFFAVGGFGGMATIGVGIGASIISSTFWTGMGLIVGGSIVLASVVAAFGGYLWSASRRHKIDKKFKLEIAEKILEKLPEICEKTVEMTANHIQAKVDEAHEDFQQQIEKHRENMEQNLIQREHDIDKMRDFSQRFSSVESRLLAWDNLGLPNPEFGPRLGSDSAFGRVYRASWRVNDKIETVAIKEFNEMSEKSYFEIVIHSMIGINQRGILPFYGAILKENSDIFSERPEICFAMPLMKFDLQTVIKDRLLITPQQRLHIALDIAYGLENMFSIVRIIHRDLKPENVLIDEIGNAFLADFGIAQINEFQRSFAGTVPYMPPETFFGARSSPRVDVYSFGILMWCVIPENPKRISDLNALPIIRKPPMVENSSLGTEYQNLMEKCWDNDENKRPNISQVISELEMIKKKYQEIKSKKN